MKYGFVLPYGDARTAADLAAVAEKHGWDGFFVWESIWGLDAWVMLAAAAMTTERIRLGTMLTPLARRRPWEVASQAATVDNLSSGRVILATGLGVDSIRQDRFWLFEDDPGRKVRAEILDEALAMLPLLWGADSFQFNGNHFRSRTTERMTPPAPPPPIQQPRIPVWVVGAWPRPKSMTRAALQDGWLPNYVPIGGLDTAPVNPHEPWRDISYRGLADGVSWIRDLRASHDLSMESYDVAMEGVTGARHSEALDRLSRWSEAGATWWIEADWSILDGLDRGSEVIRAAVRDAALRRLEEGPPRIGGA